MKASTLNAQSIVKQRIVAKRKEYVWFSSFSCIFTQAPLIPLTKI